MNGFFQYIKSGKAFFLHLLSFFFVFHGYTENYPIISARDAGLLLLVYLAAGLVLYGLSWLVLRNPFKAHLYTTGLLSVQFFSGPFIDFLRAQFPGSVISRYTIILPLLFVFITTALILLKRSQGTFSKLKVYLTSLFLLLILVDAVTLSYKMVSRPAVTETYSGSIRVCESCPKPDIYLIVADGYPGLKSLKDNFNMDNTPFLDSLRGRGFHVVDSSLSNYNFTPFSISSMLDMKFLNGIHGINSNKEDLAICFNTIKNSLTFRLLTAYGYSLYNYSIFNFSGQPSLAKPTFLPNRTTLITAQTLTVRLEKEIGYHLVTTLRLERFIRFVRMRDLENNNLLTAETQKQVTEKSDRPKFVYTHLVMPHYPYYFDSSGQAVSYSLLDDNNHHNKRSFLSYLYYSNRKLLELLDYIRKNAVRPPVIILMSDHGFREYPAPVNPEYYFNNLNAVLIPGGSYSKFYTGMSSINQFSALFNTLFDQQLPVSKDSTSLIVD
jgi:hypothetical protein